MPKGKRQERVAPVDEVPIRLRIESLAEGGYVATSPDVPGLVAEGRSVTEAVEIAQGLARRIRTREQMDGYGHIPNQCYCRSGEKSRLSLNITERSLTEWQTNRKREKANPGEMWAGWRRPVFQGLRLFSSTPPKGRGPTKRVRATRSAVTLINCQARRGSAHVC